MRLVLCCRTVDLVGRMDPYDQLDKASASGPAVTVTHTTQHDTKSDTKTDTAPPAPAPSAAAGDSKGPPASPPTQQSGGGSGSGAGSGGSGSGIKGTARESSTTTTTTTTTTATATITAGAAISGVSSSLLDEDIENDLQYTTEKLDEFYAQLRADIQARLLASQARTRQHYANQLNQLRVLHSQQVTTLQKQIDLLKEQLFWSEKRAANFLKPYEKMKSLYTDMKVVAGRADTQRKYFLLWRQNIRYTIPPKQLVSTWVDPMAKKSMCVCTVLCDGICCVISFCCAGLCVLVCR